MKILEFGEKNKEKLILIHGFQCPYQVWNKYIEHYKNDFHIIVPILSGHTVEGDFISFESEAKEIEDYIITNYGKNINAIFGFSMGGVLTATLWQNGKLYFKNVIFDGSPLVSLNGLVKRFMITFYLSVTHKSQQRDEKTLKQATKGIIPELYLNDFLTVLDSMSDITIKNCLQGVAGFKLSSDIDVTGTQIHFFHGTAMNEMLAKKSAKLISKLYPKAIVKCFMGKAHCENTLFRPDNIITELDKILF